MPKPTIFHTKRSKGFFIEHIKRTEPYYMENRHYHIPYEIYYLLSGNRNYFIQDRVYNIKRGDLILIGSNVLHKTTDGSSSFHERILIEFDISFFDGFLVNYKELPLLDAFSLDCNILRLTDSQKKQVEVCFFKILEECREKNSENNLAVKVYFLELLLLLNKFYAKENSVDFVPQNRLYKRISEVLTYINSNYQNDIGLDLVSKTFFISPAHLSRAFKKVTGFTFIEYLNNIRVHEAQKLLSETTLSITDIAKKVGYQNITHFGRMFKLITGSTPREYRKLS